MFDFLKKWGLDPKSVLYTSLAIPIGGFLIKIILKHLKDWVQYLSEGILYIISKYIKHSLAASLSMKRYCRLQLGNEKIKYLHIPSIRDISLSIDKIFVNLTISYYEEQQQSFSHKDFLTIGNRIKIMGDPGAGKSSLIKRVFRDICSEGVINPRKTKLPVLVELKNIPVDDIKTDSSGEWLYQQIKSDLKKSQIYKMDECFDNYCQTKGTLILLDGLDEVSSANYPKVSRCINELSKYLSDLSPDNVIVLTMRTQFYQQIKGDYFEHFPHSTFLMPFTPSDIYEFLSRWYFEKDSDTNISRIYKDLTDRPTLREMCSNPLILSMYVAEDQLSQNTVSPESRTLFYQKVTEELIVKRRLTQKTTISGSYSSLKEQRQKILGKIAFNHLVNIEEPRNNLKFDTAIDIIKNLLTCDEIKAEVIFDELSKETGLITEERHRESFRFIHLTFCEFMAAFEAVQGIEYGWDELMCVHRAFAQKSIDGKSRLIEVIPFAAGLLPRVSREKALDDVWELNDLVLMSKCFLETKLYSHSTWLHFITEASERLIKNVEINFDEKWLQDLHLFNVVVQDSNLASENMNLTKNIDLSKFYESLLDNDKISLNKILSAYASQDAAAVFRLSEICNINLLKDFPQIIIKNCDQIPFLGLIKDRLLQKESETKNWAALLTEAGLQMRFVSFTLNNMSANIELEKRIKQRKEHGKWYLPPEIKKTFYTQCVTLASVSESNNKYYKNLCILKELKAPSEKRYLFLFFKYNLFFFVPILPLLLIKFFDYIRINKQHQSIIIIPLFMVYVWIAISTLTRSTMENFYLAALNLINSSRRSPKVEFRMRFLRGWLMRKLIRPKNLKIIRRLIDNRGNQISE